jgi:hypothetical protein
MIAEIFAGCVALFSAVSAAMIWTEGNDTTFLATRVPLTHF